jgi:hypothetical protein
LLVSASRFPADTVYVDVRSEMRAGDLQGGMSL